MFTGILYVLHISHGTFGENLMAIKTFFTCWWFCFISTESIGNVLQLSSVITSKEKLNVGHLVNQKRWSGVGWGWSQKKFFSASYCSENKGGPGPLGLSTGSATGVKFKTQQQQQQQQQQQLTTKLGPNTLEVKTDLIYNE